MAKQYSEEIQGLLKKVVDHFDKEDSTVRERQILTWKKLKLFWEGYQKIWYSEVAHDWRIFDSIANDNHDSDQSYYDKPVNVLRAYLESIIAALSITVPPVKCYPDDADNPLDLTTAKAGDKIAQLLYRHNDVVLLWLHALFVYCTEGMVACYAYPKESAEYGTYQEKKYDEVTENHEYTHCPKCGYQIDDKTVDTPNPNLPNINSNPPMTGQPTNQPNMMQPNINQPQMGQPNGMTNQPDMNQPNIGQMNQPLMNDEFMPGEDTDLCPVCMNLMNPTVTQDTFVVTRLVGVTDQPKSRICMEVYGGLFIKVPNYAMKQEDIPYLFFNYETHFADAFEKYEHLHDKMDRSGSKPRSASGVYDTYEQWGRLSTQYQGEEPDNTVTMRNAWLRPKAFNILSHEESKRLKKEFPNGAKVVLVNDEYAEAKPESLDDHWTLTRNPLSNHLNHDPLGLLLVSIQEITNDLISLVLQTIEHGIPQTFADPAVVDFPAYNNAEIVVGGLVRATPKSGKSLSDAFHEVKTATLSGEVLPFAQNMQQMGQLVSGALPSLFGGQLEGSDTASEYSMSRAQALQRLQTPWKMLTIWWKTIHGKTIPMFIRETKDDERDVQKTKDGNFVNVMIRKAELEGKIGKVEIEANENLPMTWAQQKDLIMTLLQSANPEVLQILGTPENLPVIRNAIGLVDFFVPGEDEVTAEYDDIKMLLNSEPITMPVDPMMAQQAMMMGQPPPQPQEMSSVEVDPIIDNHQIRFEIDKKWLISEAGRQAKLDNQNGYKNVLLHAKEHFTIMQQNMMPPPLPPNQGPPQDKGAVPGEKPSKTSNKSAPITGESNVNTIQ